MTDNFKVVPYETQHGDEMIEFGLNDTLMDGDATFKENRIDFAGAGLAYTLLDDNVPICSGGIIPTWLGNAQGWVISSKRIFDFKVQAARLIRNRLNLLCANNKVWRLQTSVKANYKRGIKFAEFLGLEKEGLMRAYGPDKTDYYRMAKIYL